MKKLNKWISITIFMFACIFLLVGCVWDDPITLPQDENVTVTYSITIIGGRLAGETTQSFRKGGSTTAVTVIPQVGHKFLGWQDMMNPDGYERVDELTRRDINVQKDISVKAIMSNLITCHMAFKSPEKGGRVEGVLEQHVLYGDKGEEVRAIADEGYRFVRWSDGETNAIRDNSYVTYEGGSTSIYAEFERYERKFQYNYNGATSGNEETEIAINQDNLTEVSFPVPSREGCEFEGWYSDWHHTIQVADKNGNMLVGDEWFYNDYLYNDRMNPEGNLYAKWKSTKEIPTYKILLIFVTEIQAVLETRHYGMVEVNYLMSDVERRICEITAIRMGEYLNAIFNATVHFEIDTYFTKQVVRKENLNRGSGSPPGSDKIYDDYGIMANRNLPEVKDILDNYGSVLTTFSMNDYDNKLHIGAGSSGAKYGNINFEELVKGISDLETYFDFTYPGSFMRHEGNISGYIHEFTHSVELQLRDEDNYGLHNVSRYYSTHVAPINSEYDYMIDYLRDRFEIDEGVKVGIPFEFWSGKYFKKEN